MRGKLIVIDGSDGSGKATQTKILVRSLRRQNYKVKTVDFPQYGKKSAGMVEEYLNGKYGSANEVGPYAASLFYALDRYDASFTIRKWLKQGYIIIANRYVSSNKGHQLAKITNKKEKENYLKWLDNIEYGILKVPREDLVIILYVPAKIAQTLVDMKGFRKYVNGKKRDIHEKDINHLKRAEKTYKELTKKYRNWKLIDCTRKDGLLTKKEIAEKVWSVVRRSL